MTGPSADSDLVSESACGYVRVRLCVCVCARKRARTHVYVVPPPFLF